MDIEDIKVGETYNVRVKIIEKYGDCVDAIYAEYDAIEGIHIPKRRIGILHPISPENGTKNTETAPKYDPNRIFRKSDKVRVVEWNGRCPQCEGLLGKITTVLRDENYFGVRIQIGDSGESYCTPEPCFLELVTPVEELEPYCVGETTDYFSVDKDDEELSLYWKDKHPHAKEAAEAECARLNAEWRKEQK